MERDGKLDMTYRPRHLGPRPHVEVTTWWIVYDFSKKFMASKQRGSGARYALATMHGHEAGIRAQFLDSLVQLFKTRGPALELLGELNFVDEVMSS